MTSLRLALILGAGIASQRG